MRTLAAIFLGLAAACAARNSKPVERSKDDDETDALSRMDRRAIIVFVGRCVEAGDPQQAMGGPRIGAEFEVEDVEFGNLSVSHVWVSKFSSGKDRPVVGMRYRIWLDFFDAGGSAVRIDAEGNDPGEPPFEIEPRGVASMWIEHGPSCPTHEELKEWGKKWGNETPASDDDEY